MSDVKPEGTTSGAPKRRRRRRSRRPSGQNQNPRSTQDQQQAGGENTGKSRAPSDNATGTEGAKGATANPNRRKRSRRRGRTGGGGNTSGSNSSSNSSSNSGTAGTGTSQQTTATPGTRGEGRSGGRRKASNQRRRPHRGNQRVHQAGQLSRMETSNETSAGGLVVSGLAESVGADNQVDLSKIYVALIGRLDRRGRLLWSMPKGHVEPGEDKAATAEREVWEETGIHGEVFTELGVIDYWFVSEGRRIHKTVHHHLLRYVDGDLNDEDPEVTEVSWIPANQLIEHLAFADERKLARQAHDMLPEFARREKAEGRATPR
ncbi:Putative mutator protein MutT4 [Corynebacterium faecale]|uniref:NUDIX hydrolase n=1 Tax=Corynebacterium faecale TaxID=1758466 RepID=UPI0025B2DDE7|nr:NUDIX hydrolase [Corynebacterium faecale]WJY93495.1 Putative mutator protein MutT4 [Corynebacterium faecale]